jgi:hypothetical protein
MRSRVRLRAMTSLLVASLAVITVFGQSKRKRATTKRPEPQVILPCGVRLTSEASLAAGTVGGSPWLLAASSHEENFYYNRNWVCDHVVIRIWVKALSRDANNPAIRSMSLYELKCKTRQIRVTQTVEYDQDGKVQTSDDTNKARWRDAVPESIGEGILNTICGVRE